MSVHSKQGITASWILICILGFVVLGSQPPKKPKLTGTYTSMRFNAQAGDVLGEELRIVLTRKGYQGVLQFAEGGPEELILLNLRINGVRLSFTIPETHPDAGDFSGVISETGIVGKFSFKNSPELKVNLKRGKSYWD